MKPPRIPALTRLARRAFALAPALALGLLVASTASCAITRTTHNHPLPREVVEQLRPGQPASEVVQLLGAPVDVVQLGRRSAYRYDYRITKRAGLLAVIVVLFNEDTRSDRVWVFFDEDERLSHVATTLEGDRAKYAMPWVKIHED